MRFFHASLLPRKLVLKLFVFFLVAAAVELTLLAGYYLSLGGSLTSPPPLGGLLFAPKIDYPVVILPPPGLWPGIRQPRTVPGEKATLDKQTEIIGVCIEGRARAYSLEAMSSNPSNHVVNDVLADHPVSVSYCDRMDCARVFTTETLGTSLDLDVGGWKEGKGMLLRIHDVKYTLKDGENITDPEGPPLPYQDLKYERTSWGNWLRAHPQSDVYVGPQ